MVKVRKCKDISKDGKQFHILEVEDENDERAYNIFVDQHIDAGTYLIAEPYVNTFTHKLAFNLKPLLEKR